MFTRISAGVDDCPCFTTFYCYDPYSLLGRAPHKLVVTVRCTNVACPKFYGDITTLVVIAYVIGVPKIYSGKPHMLRNMWSIWRPMLPLIPEKSDLKGDENLNAKTNGEFWRRIAHTP